MPPTAGSSSASSSSTSKTAASSSRAVKIPHFEEQASTHIHNLRTHERHRQPTSRPDALLRRSDSSDSSSPPHSATRSVSHHAIIAAGASSSSSSYSSSFETLLYKPVSSSSSTSTSKFKAIRSAIASPPPNTLIPPHPSPLGPSMASSASYRSINLNSDFGADSGSPPHLITYTKTGQGFTWNEELFLPSYMMGRYEAGGGRRRRRRYEDDDLGGGGGGDDEVVEIAEIFVSEEEARDMMP